MGTGGTGVLIKHPTVLWSIMDAILIWPPNSFLLYISYPSVAKNADSKVKQTLIDKLHLKIYTGVLRPFFAP